jgi:hypothetical protein
MPPSSATACTSVSEVIDEDIQGDSLSILQQLASDAAEALRTDNSVEAGDALRRLVRELQEAQGRYEAALKKHGIPLPYTQRAKVSFVSFSDQRGRVAREDDDAAGTQYAYEGGLDRNLAGAGPRSPAFVQRRARLGGRAVG